MKNFMLILFILGMGKISLAQTNTFPPNGNAGIGTTSPQGSLEVASATRAEIFMSDTQISTPFISILQSGTVGRISQSYNDHGGIALQGWTNNASSFATSIQGYIGSSTPTAAAVHIQGYKLNGTAEVAMNGTDKILQISAGTSALTTFLANGDVGIGTANPQGYKLAVNGSMIAESVKVKLYANWPDYVFEPSYKLPDLKETEQFIKENKRLPEIPSAEQVKKNGINLGEMNAKLLQKIEELTIYLIDQNKKLENQGRLINTLLKKVEIFEK